MKVVAHTAGRRIKQHEEGGEPMDDLERVLERLVTDRRFLQQIAADPASALESYDLTEEERQLLASRVEEAAGQSRVEQRTSKAGLSSLLTDALGAATASQDGAGVGSDYGSVGLFQQQTGSAHADVDDPRLAGTTSSADMDKDLKAIMAEVKPMSPSPQSDDAEILTQTGHENPDGASFDQSMTLNLSHPSVGGNSAGSETEAHWTSDDRSGDAAAFNPKELSINKPVTWQKDELSPGEQGSIVDGGGADSPSGRRVLKVDGFALKQHVHEESVEAEPPLVGKGPEPIAANEQAPTGRQYASQLLQVTAATHVDARSTPDTDEGAPDLGSWSKVDGVAVGLDPHVENELADKVAGTPGEPPAAVSRDADLVIEGQNISNDVVSDPGEPSPAPKSGTVVAGEFSYKERTRRNFEDIDYDSGTISLGTAADSTSGEDGILLEDKTGAELISSAGSPADGQTEGDADRPIINARIYNGPENPQEDSADETSHETVFKGEVTGIEPTYDTD